MVRRARQEEMVYLSNKNVYTKHPLQEAFEKIGKQPVGVRWVDTNKVDD